MQNFHLSPDNLQNIENFKNFDRSRCLFSPGEHFLYLYISRFSKSTVQLTKSLIFYRYFYIFSSRNFQPLSLIFYLYPFFLSLSLVPFILAHQSSSIISSVRRHGVPPHAESVSLFVDLSD